MTIPIILVDDCSVSYEGLRSYFSTKGGEIEIASIFTHGAEALSYLSANDFTPPKVILFRYDIEHGMTAVQFATELQKRGWAMPLVVYSAPDDELVAAALLAAGVAGYVLKRALLEQIREAIDAARRGETWVSPAITPRLAARAQRQAVEILGLIVRERRVLELLAEGLKNQEIAFRLNLAEQTVKNTISSLYKKLDMGGRTQLVHKACELFPLIKQTNTREGSEKGR